MSSSENRETLSFHLCADKHLKSTIYQYAFIINNTWHWRFNIQGNYVKQRLRPLSHTAASHWRPGPVSPRWT